MSKLIEFLKGTGKHPNGQTLDEILKWSDDQLEYSHDVIQWLFPLDEPSQCQPYSPVLSSEDVKYIKTDSDIKNNLLKSLSRFIKFWSSDHWFTPRNHNYLRVTRVLKCLGLSGMKAQKDMFKVLVDLYYYNNSEVIGPITKKFWDEA